MTPPRVIRLRDAPGYLGMHKDVFEREVRPYLREARVGSPVIGSSPTENQPLGAPVAGRLSGQRRTAPNDVLQKSCRGAVL